MNKLELLNDLTCTRINVHKGCMTIIKLIRTGNILHNEDNSIEIDIDQIVLSGRTQKSVFKSLLQQVYAIMVANYPNHEFMKTVLWANDRGYKLYVDYNGDMFNENNFIMAV